MTNDTTPSAAVRRREFINFDGRITGETARLVKASAQVMGVTPQHVLQLALSSFLDQKLNVNTEGDVKVEPWTPNEGAGGFHVVTVVADGYGYLVAENAQGEERARVACQTPEEAADAPGKDLRALMNAFTVRSMDGS